MQDVTTTTTTEQGAVTEGTVLPPVGQADAAPAVTAPFKVDPLKGGHDGTVSGQWASRPDDERFTSLADLEAATQRWADASAERAVNLNQVAATVSAGKLSIIAGGDSITEYDAPSHWAFGQLAFMAKAPANYLRSLPAPLAAACLNEGLHRSTSGAAKVYGYQETDTGRSVLRAVTGSNYGRIYDADVVRALRRVAGNGTGDTRWKVPGVMDWQTHMYDPFAPITKASTTLYASDRDVFAFLVDDTHPIEVGKLADGNPDLMFRGFYCWNSEVGARSFGIAAFYLRAVCMNRNLWGVEGYNEITVRHTAKGPTAFIEQALPTLEAYANQATRSVVDGVALARAARPWHDDEGRFDFLRGRAELTKGQAEKVLDLHMKEEGRPIESVWDVAQGITAFARSVPYQDERLLVERKAKKLLDKVVA